MERDKHAASSIKKAVASLESAMRALVNERNMAERMIWEAASETEYAVFILSLLQRSEEHSWKSGYKQKMGEIEVGPALISAQDLLKEAEKIVNTNPEEAYRKAWMARHYILRAQRLLTKKE